MLQQILPCDEDEPPKKRAQGN
ncbi:hypothetical protein RDI58_007151 [Solanum bulbocastanum]|uniref:Uncharacterized protein n=1 Tax=Solanum bulbocastanum TaxID=147425 RepID=A0AAN8TSA5_SOLBU